MNEKLTDFMLNDEVNIQEILGKISRSYILISLLPCLASLHFLFYTDCKKTYSSRTVFFVSEKKNNAFQIFGNDGISNLLGFNVIDDAGPVISILQGRDFLINIVKDLNSTFRSRIC